MSLTQAANEARQLQGEPEWIEAMRAGDHGAFEALFRAYYASLCSFAYRYLGARDMAEEIVQEVFLCIWERRERWDVRTSVRSYLLTSRQNDLVGAVDAYNLIRDRAGLPTHTLGNEVTTQEEVLAEIDLQRQLELAFEGDRWPDLVRTGRAVEVMQMPEYQALYPIPQTEVDVAPGVTQNPGY